MMSDLTDREILRYSRHFPLSAIGVKGQKKLKAASVLLIGVGGLGSPLALYLAAAGVGRIGLVDFDIVDESNLQRQILYGSSVVGTSKIESAVRRLQDLNSFIALEPHSMQLSAGNALDLFKNYDVIADGADNFQTRYLVNDAAVLTGKPLVSGAVFEFMGQLSVFNYHDGPCYRCLFPQMPDPGSVPSCSEAGILGMLPGVVGTLQAVEVIKVLLGIERVASGALILYDALKLSFDRLKIRKNPDCPMCGLKRSIYELTDDLYGCEINVDDSISIDQIDVIDFHQRKSSFILIDVREDYERKICAIQDSIHIPLRNIDRQTYTLNKSDSIVIYCKSGARSMRAARRLVERGFLDVRILRGGVMAWINKIDHELIRY